MDKILYFIFFGLPTLAFIYLAIDQLLWAWNTDLDSEIKRFIKWIY